MGEVGEALANAAKSAGVEIRTGTKVERIIVEDGVVAGVLLESGEHISARWVVSNADAKINLFGYGRKAEPGCHVYASHR